MKNFIWVLLACLLCTVSVRAAELPQELREALPQGAEELLEHLDTSGSNALSDGVSRILENAAGKVRAVFKERLHSAVSILLVVILCGIIDSVSKATGSTVSAKALTMIRILRRRYPLARVILLPVRVQGTEAPPEIAGAIRYTNRWRVADLIITGRGGGSIEDLWAFNDERVARAIYESRLPVISAVGHEPDVTISDFVADARASTPSNAAEIAVPDQAELLRRLQGTGAQLAQTEAARLKTLRQKLDALAQKRVLKQQTAYVQDRRMGLVHLQQRLSDLSGSLLSRKRERYSALAAALDAMSPLKVLGRGYAM